MFAKIFGQIFESSIADNHKHRHIFMDLLVLADSDGVVDMTVEAVARRTNVPLEDVREAITAFCLPDERSNSPHEEGRRLLPIDQRKQWGWQIVNYHHYRAIRDEESRRAYMREYMRAEREKKRPKKKKQPKPAKPQFDKIVTNGFTDRPPAHKLGCRCEECLLVGATPREPL
jgi:hypothetical protein